MRRREFITLLGGAAAGLPLASVAEESATPVVGFLHPATAETTTEIIEAFRRGLAETGYVEGRNVVIEYRFADGRNERLAALAADLASRRVAVIVAPGGDSSAFAAKAATAMIPIVSSFASDPVRNGLVHSLSRPGGNLTGVAQFSAGLMPKRLEILSEAVPQAALIDVLVNPEGAITAGATKDVEAAAHVRGRQIRVHTARNEDEIAAAFAKLPQLGAQALLVMADSFFRSRIEQVGALTVRYAMPAMSSYRSFVTAGGLMAYHSNLNDGYRLVGVYTGRILKGEKPANLAVQQATKIDLIINLQTAKALGLTLPATLLARADEVIE